MYPNGKQYSVMTASYVPATSSITGSHCGIRYCVFWMFIFEGISKKRETEMSPCVSPKCYMRDRL